MPLFFRPGPIAITSHCAGVQQYDSMVFVFSMLVNHAQNVPQLAPRSPLPARQTRTACTAVPAEHSIHAAWSEGEIGAVEAFAVALRLRQQTNALPRSLLEFRPPRVMRLTKLLCRTPLPTEFLERARESSSSELKTPQRRKAKFEEGHEQENDDWRPPADPFGLMPRLGTAIAFLRRVSQRGRVQRLWVRQQLQPRPLELMKRKANAAPSLLDIGRCERARSDALDVVIAPHSAPRRTWPRGASNNEQAATARLYFFPSPPPHSLASRASPELRTSEQGTEHLRSADRAVRAARGICRILLRWVFLSRSPRSLHSSSAGPTDSPACSEAPATLYSTTERPAHRRRDARTSTWRSLHNTPPLGTSKRPRFRPLTWARTSRRQLCRRTLQLTAWRRCTRGMAGSSEVASLATDVGASMLTSSACFACSRQD